MTDDRKSKERSSAFAKLENSGTLKQSDALRALERKQAEISRSTGLSFEKATYVPGAGKTSAALEVTYVPGAGKASAALEALSYVPVAPPPIENSSSSPLGSYYGASETPVNNSPAARMMIATSMINPLIERAERAIARLGFHVTATIELEREDGAHGWSRHLRFGKSGKEWCLTVEAGLETDEDWPTARLHTASRETRLLALSKLPELVDALSGRAEEEASAAQKVVSEAQAFIASLECTPQ